MNNKQTNGHIYEVHTIKLPHNLQQLLSIITLNSDKKKYHKSLRFWFYEKQRKHRIFFCLYGLVISTEHWHHLKKKRIFGGFLLRRRGWQRISTIFFMFCALMEILRRGRNSPKLKFASIFTTAIEHQLNCIIVSLMHLCTLLRIFQLSFFFKIINHFKFRTHRRIGLCIFSLNSFVFPVIFANNCTLKYVCVLILFEIFVIRSYFSIVGDEMGVSQYHRHNIWLR